MQHIVVKTFNVHLFLHYSNQVVGYDRRVDQNADNVFGLTTELLYLQMLLEALKEKFDLSSFVIEYRDHYWADNLSIGEEYEFLLALFVSVDIDSTDFY